MFSLFPKWNELFPHWGHTIQLPDWLNPVLNAGPTSQEELDFARRIEAAPKIELHVHVEAAVGADFYTKLNSKLKFYDPQRMPALRAPFATFRDFILAWVDNSKLITNEDLLFDMAKGFVHERKKQNIVYTEAHVSAPDFTFLRARFSKDSVALDLEKSLRAYASGIAQGEQECPGFKVRLIADAVWPSLLAEMDMFAQTFAKVVMSKDNHDMAGNSIYVAVGLGGPELSQRAEEIIPFLDRCRDFGLKVDIHSGENTSLEEHQHSISVLKPDRIAHGIAGAELGWFFAGHISACPLSNVMSGAIKGDFSQHPIVQMYEKNVHFSIGSDDPLLFSNTLTLEYVALRKAFGWEFPFFEKTQANAREAAFAL